MEFKTPVEKRRFGALELKNQVGPNLLKGLLVSLLIHSSVIATPFIYMLLRGVDVVAEHVTGPVWIDPPPTPGLPTQEPPPVIAIPLPPDAAKFVVPTPVDSDMVEIDAKQVPDQGTIGRAKGISPDSAGDMDGGGALVTDQVEIPDEDEPTHLPGDFVPVEVQPQPLTDNPQPEYPEIAREAGVAAKVVVQFYVDKRGHVKQPSIVHCNAPDLGFEAAVMKVITEWKFTPAIQSGRPIGVWVAMPFKFRVDK